MRMASTMQSEDGQHYVVVVRDMVKAGQTAAKKLDDISDEEQHRMLKV